MLEQKKYFWGRVLGTPQPPTCCYCGHIIIIILSILALLSTIIITIVTYHPLTTAVRSATHQHQCYHH
jgi:hypothetical protein